MRLNQISDKVALKVLGEPGTLVEVMIAAFFIEKGKISKVIGKDYFGNLHIEGIKDSIHPRRFRKVG